MSSGVIKYININSLTKKQHLNSWFTWLLFLELSTTSHSPPPHDTVCSLVTVESSGKSK